MQTNTWQTTTECFRGGWTDISSKIPWHQGWANCDSNVFLRGTCSVIPSSLQHRVLNLAYEGHQGLVKAKPLLGKKVWFPDIDSKTKQLAALCLPCSASTPETTRKFCKSWSYPQLHGLEVSTDFCAPFPSNDYLLVINDYSQYPILEISKSMSAKVIFSILDNISSSLGIPQVVKTDDGPNFQGHEFLQFAVSILVFYNSK